MSSRHCSLKTRQGLVELLLRFDAAAEVARRGDSTMRLPFRRRMISSTAVESRPEQASKSERSSGIAIDSRPVGGRAGHEWLRNALPLILVELLPARRRIQRRDCLLHRLQLWRQSASLRRRSCSFSSARVCSPMAGKLTEKRLPGHQISQSLRVGADAIIEVGLAFQEGPQLCQRGSRREPSRAELAR